MDFGKILKQGKRRFESKNESGGWGKCDYCNYRRLLFSYKDNKKEMWELCDECTDLFVKEEE